MRWTTASAATLALLLAGPAFAQSGAGQMGAGQSPGSQPGASSTDTTSSGAATSGAGGGMQAGTGSATGSGKPMSAMTQRKLQDALKAAGFENVQVVDAAYLVQARTQDGDMVMMVINPPATASGSTGSSMGSGSGSSSMGSGSQPEGSGNQ